MSMNNSNNDNSNEKRMVTREVIQKPGRGRKIVMGIGVVMLSLIILSAAGLLEVAQARNAPIEGLSGPMFVMLILLIISLLMIRVGRTRSYTVTEVISSKDLIN